MIAGIKMQKESLIHNQRIYIALPKRLYDDEILSRAISFLHSLKPFSIDDPRDMFASNIDWEKAFPNYLKIYDTVVIVTDNGFVGRGVHKEIEYFDRKKKPCYQYVERGKHQNILPVKALRIVNWNNWIDYAMVEYE